MSYFTPFLHRLLLRGNEVQTHCVISHGNERGFKWQANNWKAWDKGTRCSGPGSTCTRTYTQAVGNQKTKNGIQIQSLYLSVFTCVHRTIDVKYIPKSSFFTLQKSKTHFSHVKLYASKVCIVFKNIPIEVVELPLFCFTLGLPGSESKHG